MAYVEQNPDSIILVLQTMKFEHTCNLYEVIFYVRKYKTTNRVETNY
jgi:hypothetical protein